MGELMNDLVANGNLARALGPYQWNSMAELAESLRRMSKDIAGMQREVLRSGAQAAHLIEYAYGYAGVSDAEASTRAGSMLKLFQGMDATLGEVQTHIKEMKNVAKGAVNALDDADAQRKIARQKLGN